MDKPHYTRVRHGKSTHPMGSFDALWQSDDHLLLVQNRIYTQTYRRFYFSDIQGLVAQVTNRRSLSAWLLGVANILPLSAAAVVDHGLSRFIWLAVALLFAVVFAVNWFRGPTCRATIVTRVQSYPLPLTRLKKARRVFAGLRAAIEHHQGRIDPAAVAAPLVIADQPGGRRHRGSQPAERGDYAYGGWFHLVFFALLLIIAAMNGLQLSVQHGSIVAAETILALVSMLFMVLALKNQHASAMDGWLKKNTWAALVLIFVLVGVSYADFLVSITAMADQEAAPSHHQMVLFMARRNPADFPFMRYILLIHVLTLPLVALPGLVQTLRFQKIRRVAR